MNSKGGLYRSVLYIPGARARALDKARGLDVDAIIFDLEDAVAPDEKISARATLTEALGQGGFGHRFRIVRINGLDTEWGAGDAEAVAAMDCDAVLIPKVESAASNEVCKAVIICDRSPPRSHLNSFARSLVPITNPCTRG